MTREDQHLRRHQIFTAAIALFLQKGFQETTMQEIARAAGMGKSTLYDSFRTKDDILASFVEEEINDLLELVQPVAEAHRPPAEKLREVMLVHMQTLIDHKEVYLKLTFEVQRLPYASQQRIQERRHVYQDLLCRLVEAAVREGAFRRVNPLLAVRTILALLPPAVYASRPTGTPEQMVNEALDIFYHGVMKQV